MLCPLCQTENRDDQETCYHCNKDLSMLQVVVNKAKQHYNQGLEFAERNQVDEAIGEMRNALDLDATMINAHVVLGTLYAKKSNFDEARKSWTDALNVDYRLMKAHQYLDKAEQAQYVFPAVARLKVVAMWLGGLFVFFLVVSLIFSNHWLSLTACFLLAAGYAIHQTIPQEGIPEVRQAIKLVLTDEPDLNKASAILDEVEKKPSVSTVAREFIRRMRVHIAQQRAVQSGHWNDLFIQATEAYDLDAPAMAIKLLASLEKAGPDASLAPKIAPLRQRALDLLKTRIDDAIAGFRRGDASYESFERDARSFLAARLMPERASEVQGLLEEFRGEHDKKMKLDALASIRDAADVPAALAAAETWKARAPQLQDDLAEEVKSRLARAEDETRTALRDLVNQGQLDAARQRVEELADWYRNATLGDDAQPDAVSAMLDELAAARQRQAALAEVDAAYDGKDYARFLALTEDAPAVTPDTAEQAKLAARRREAQEALAQAEWEWMSSHSRAFEEGTLSEDDAARVAASYESTIRNLTNDSSYAEAPILFYAAAAQLKLGNVAEARRLLKLIEDEHAISYIVSSVKAFRERFSAALGETAPLADESSPTPR